jgi:hypothetical protein
MSKASLEKCRKHYRDWYERHKNEFNAQRKARYKPVLRGLVRREASALRYIARRVRTARKGRRFSLSSAAGRAAHIAERNIRGRSRLLNSQGRVVSLRWILMNILAGVRSGALSLDPASPSYPSIDQHVAGLGYGEANARVVPRWYNLAKCAWDPADVDQAIRAWVAVSVEKMAP